MNAAARKIQRTYLTLMLGNTLAASFIWGINTLFLLDAGLSNLEAFAANAFFTAGMVLFEVPTGVVADSWGRRVSYLLGTLTLAGSTSSTTCSGCSRRRSGRGRSSRCCSGSASPSSRARSRPGSSTRCTFSGYEGGLEAVLGRGQMVAGVAMLAGSVAGGVIAQATDLGVPFLLRVGVLLAMFVVAWWLMHDVGFTPETLGAHAAGDAGGLRRLDRERAEESAGALGDAGRAVHRRRRHLHVLRPAAVPARALRRPARVLGRRASRRRSSPARRCSAAGWRRGSGRCSQAHDRADPRRDRERLDPGAARRSRLVLAGAGAARRLGHCLRGGHADAPGLPERHDPVEAAGHGAFVRLADGIERRGRDPARRSGRRPTRTAMGPRSPSARSSSCAPSRSSSEAGTEGAAADRAVSLAEPTEPATAATP